MKEKKEIQTKLNKDKLKQWTFQDPRISMGIISDTAKSLTNDIKLQKDLIQYHTELLDRRYSGSIELYDKNNQLGIKIELHGFDPQIILLLQEYIEYNVFDKKYLSEEKFKLWLNEKKINVERIYVKNYEDLEQIGNIKYDVNFY